jgi:hypothetical protein
VGKLRPRGVQEAASASPSAVELLASRDGVVGAIVLVGDVVGVDCRRGEGE